MPLKIEYIYYHTNASGSSYPVATKQPIKHQISKKLINDFLEQKDEHYLFTQEDLLWLLQMDGARISIESIRYYDSDQDAFIKLDKDFVLEINKDKSQYLLLWVDRKNSKRWAKLNALVRRVQRLEKKIDERKQLSADLQTDSANICSTFSIKAIDTKERCLSDSKLEITESKSPDMIPRSPSVGGFFDLIKSHYVASDKKLDIVIMYAEPLVQLKGNNTTQSLPDAVDYEGECRFIYENLQQTGARIQLMIEIATRTNLVSVLSKSPKILHIVCHGEYDTERRQFYLCLEKTTGELDPLYSDDLKEILTSCETKVQLVFVNACHSEPVARVFAEAGVPCVIAVQSQALIADFFAKKFSNEFYKYIFDCKSIKEAFQLAVIASKDPSAYSCCCAHSHKPNCLWIKEAHRDSYSTAHMYHVPSCLTCPKRCANIHKWDCEWAQNFAERYCPDREPNFDSLTVETCCCSPELPHNELMKFVIISKDKQNVEQLVLIESFEPGKVHNHKVYSILDQKFPEKRLIGRNRELYELYNYLQGSKKVVKLVGGIGMGKTALSRQLGNYLYVRNRFRYKISVVDLNRMNSVSSFLTKIFSEFDQVNDIYSFCETLLTKEALYIIENCDLFVEKNRKEFADCLRQIVKNTKHVKFLLLIGKPDDLDLHEVNVKLGSLFPGDAAKLLLMNTPIEKINPKELRNLEELKNMELFKKYYARVSTQMIWRISRKLIQEKNPDLLSIQSEIIKELNTTNSQGEADKLSIERTLHDIKLQNFEGYTLILRICSFSSGLTHADAQECSRLGLIAPQWVAILKNLLGTKDHELNQPTEAEILALEATSLPLLKKKSKLPRSGVFHSLKAGHYFWLRIVTEKDTNNLIFQPVTVVRGVLYENLNRDLLEAEIAKMKYLSIFSLGLLARLKEINAYSQELVENSAVCERGLWRIREKNVIFKQICNEHTLIDYLNSDSNMNHFEELNSCFELHNGNFKECFNLPILQEILKQEDLKSVFIDTIEILWLVIPTLFKIFAKNSDISIALASKALNVLNELQLQDEITSLTKIKIRLFLIGVFISQKDQDAIELQISIKNQLELIDSLTTEIKDEEISKRIEFEIAFSKAKLQYNIKKGSYKNNQEFEDRSQKFLPILSLLENRCETFLEGLSADFDLDQARVTLLSCQVHVQLNEPSVQATIKEKIEKAIEVFKQHCCCRLEMKMHICFARLYMGINLQRQKSGSNFNNISQESAFLNHIRKEHLKENALQIAKATKSAKSIIKINELINILSSKIHQTLYNMMVFLHADPLISSLSDSKKDWQNQMRIPSCGKSDLIEVLSKRAKAINIKFATLTRSSLEEVVSGGCRILYLGSEIMNEEGLVIEGPDCKPVILSIYELGIMFQKIHKRHHSINSKEKSEEAAAPLKPKIDMVVLGSNISSEIANWFADDLQIPHVVHFEFIDAPKIEEYKMKLYVQEYISKFLQYFLNELVAGKAIQQAFETAKEDTLDCMSYSFFDNLDGEGIRKLIGQGTILLPSSEKYHINPHNQPLFGFGDYILHEGKIEDMSIQLPPTNLHHSIVPYFGRTQEMSQIVDILKDYFLNDTPTMNGFLKISGEQGVGKTRLVLEIGWYLLQRNLFPDGIFYLPLRRVHGTSVYTMIERSFQKFESAKDQNYANFFRNKKMLMIFDDFDIFYQGLVEFPSLIFSMLKKYKIPVIVTTTGYRLRDTLDEADQTMLRHFQDNKFRLESQYIDKTLDLNRLDKSHIANMFISLTSTNVSGPIRYKRVLKHRYQDQLIRGIPAGVVELLVKKKLSYMGKPVQMYPQYEPFQMLDIRYKHYLKTGRELIEIEQMVSVLPISRHSARFLEEAGQMTNSVHLKASKKKQLFDFSDIEPENSLDEETTHFRNSKKESTRLSFMRGPTHDMDNLDPSLTRLDSTQSEKGEVDQSDFQSQLT